MRFLKFITSKAFLVQLILAGITAVLLVFLTLKWLDYETDHGEKIKVPDLSKLQLDEVDDKLGDLDLRRTILDSVNYNPSYPKFSVIEQDPEPGRYVKENRKIYLKLNPSGYPKIEIPDLIRHTKRQVEPTLRSMGFEIGDTVYKHDIAKDAVLELYADGEKIKPGDKVKKKTTIDLVLGDGETEKSKDEDDKDDKSDEEGDEEKQDD